MDETMGRRIKQRSEFHTHLPNARWTTTSILAHTRQCHGGIYVKRGELGLKGMIYAHEQKHIRHGKEK